VLPLDPLPLLYQLGDLHGVFVLEPVLLLQIVLDLRGPYYMLALAANNNMQASDLLK
jgi:hypothetical protein